MTEQDSSETSLARLFEAQVARSPDRVACESGSATVTFRRLNAMANQLARRLRARGISSRHRVAISTRRSLDLPVGLLAILKLGASFVPIDMSWPLPRRCSIVTSAGVRAFLARAHEESAWFAGEVCAVSERWPDIVSEDGHDLHAVEWPDLCCVLATSGTSGTPKLVMVRTRSVFDHLVWMRQVFELGGRDVALVHKPLSVIGGVFDLLGALCSGARSVVLSDDEAAEPAQIWRAGASKGATYMAAAPVLWRALVDEGERASLRWNALRVGKSGGGPLSADLARAWQRLWPNASLFNTYGSTEMVATYQLVATIPEEARTVSVGRAFPNSHVYVLDRALNPIAAGDAGQVCVSGTAVSLGYLNLPGLTAERFVPNPLSSEPSQRLFRTGDIGRWNGGSLEILGRWDGEIKLRGHRVDPFDVERALLRHPEVKEAIVIAYETAPDETMLCAYLVVDQGKDVNAGNIRAFLRTQLPDYCVPARFVVVDALPRTPLGKIDRTVLRTSPVTESTGETRGAPASTETQRALAAIWMDILKTSQVDRDCDLLAMGGDSLSAIKIAAEIERRWAVAVSVRDLLSGATIETVAARIEAVVSA